MSTTTVQPAGQSLPSWSPRRPLRQLGELSRTTPGVLGLLAALLVVVSLAVGILTALSVQRRSAALQDLTERSGPLSVAAQEIYRSLSDADATATSAFLAGGLEPGPVRARYEADIAQAEAAMTVAVAARDIGDVTDPGNPLATLSGQLSVYTGLVETARANNRQGLPVGAAYQREASNLMGTRLLPAAQALYRAETDRVAGDQDDAGSWPIVELLLTLIGLGVLVATQRYLMRQTNRVFNVGLLVGTAAAVLAMIWVLVATIGVIVNVAASKGDGSAQVDTLAQARIEALKARGNETLTLVARGSGQAYENGYVQDSEDLASLLGQATNLTTEPGVRAKVDSAVTNQGTWRAAHQKIRNADDGGNYADAVVLTIGSAPDSAASAFDRLDADLRDAIDATRQSFDNEVAEARDAIGGTVAAVILLAVVTAAGAAAGIWQRLKEYR